MLAATLAIALLALTPPPAPPPKAARLGPDKAYHLAFRALALSQPKITSFLLDEALFTPDSSAGFHGAPIIQVAPLSESQAVRLLEVLSLPKTYDIPYDGVPGCIGWGVGLRFEEQGRTVDVFVCLACHWVFSPEHTEPSVSLVLSESGADVLRTLLREVFPSSSTFGCRP